MLKNDVTRVKVENKQKETHDLIETIFEGNEGQEDKIQKIDA